MFIHESAEVDELRRQTVRTEVFAVSNTVQGQRYPIFAQSVAVVPVTHLHEQTLHRMDS